jgi:3-oxoadipate enol-lactonase
MPFLITRKPVLHYRVDDHTEPWRDAGTVVLQHGYARSSLFWHAWIPHLSGRYRVVRPDLRGHGESPVDFDPAAPHMLDAYVGDVIAVLDALGVDAVHYCGESFGGIIGMALAAQHPRRVRTLTLIAAPVYQNQTSQDVYAAGFPTREQALRTLGTRKWAEAVYGAPGFFPEGTDPRLRDWYVGEIARSDAEVLCGLYGTLLRTASAEALLPEIAAPVLGLYPTSGLLTSSEQENLLARGIRDLTMIHLPTSSHAILTLYPAECAEHLLNFITGHDRQAGDSMPAPARPAP